MRSIVTQARGARIRAVVLRSLLWNILQSYTHTHTLSIPSVVGITRHECTCSFTNLLSQRRAMGIQSIISSLPHKVALHGCRTIGQNGLVQHVVIGGSIRFQMDNLIQGRLGIRHDVVNERMTVKNVKDLVRSIEDYKYIFVMVRLLAKGWLDTWVQPKLLLLLSR